jgi:CubicO group peptidase (beta-lactamase class C family)
MTRFARFLMSGLAADGETLLERRWLERMASTDVAIDPPSPFDDLPLWADPRRVNGAGLQRHEDLLGHDVWAHGGGVMGGTAYVAVVPSERLGVVLLANAHGYPMAQLALVALASLLGAEPEALPFVRRQRLIERAAGRYASWAGTIHADLAPRGWGLELRLAFEPGGRSVPLVLLDHDDDLDVTRFMALGGGRPGAAEVRHGADGTVLVYDRYALHRRGESRP